MLRLALLLCLPLLLTACGQDEAPPVSVRPAMVVQPQPVGPVADTYAGEVRARHEPQLAFRVGGKVIKRLVEEGDRVKADQPLAELDPQDVRLQLEAARAQVAAAQANLTLVRAERDRYKTLLDKGMVSHSLFDNAESQLRAGEARLRQIQAEYSVANNQATYAVLRASGNGVIARRQVEVGQVVAAGQTVFVLAADGEREVAISLPEQSFARFTVGQPVVVELWSPPQSRYQGQIRELSPSADPRTRTFAARVAFVAGPKAPDLGQSARVLVQAGQAVPLSVPLSAVSAERGSHFVWRVKTDNSLERTAVKTGPFTEASVPVLEGLGPNDWIVAAGVHVLHEGQTVRPVDRNNRQVDVARKQ